MMGHKQSKEQKSEIYTISGHRYKETVILFREKIIRDIIPSQILPYLHFLNDADRSAIKAEQDQHKAVELILDRITASDDLGKWKTFVQALEQCGFKAVANTLRLLPVPDSGNQRQILHILSPKLRDMIKPSEITSELLSREVIHSADMEEIHQKERNAGAIAAADLLLDRIPRKHPFWFLHFFQALKNAGHSDLVLMLSVGLDIEANPEEPEKRETGLLGSSIANGQSLEISTGTGRDTSITERKTEYQCGENCQTEGCNYERKRENSNLEKESYINTGEKRLTSSNTAAPIRIDAQGEVKDESSENCETKEFIFASCGEVQRDYSRLNTKFEKEYEICFDGKLTSQNLQKRIKEKKDALISENVDLECTLEECKEYLKAYEKKVELLKMINDVCEKIKEKEEEEAALKSCKNILKDLDVS